MTIDNSGSVPKKYYRLADLAKRWNLEVSELLNYAIEGVLHVAIEEFHGADCNDGDGEANGGRTVAYPCWAVFLVPDALKKIAVYGEVKYCWWPTHDLLWLSTDVLSTTAAYR